MTKHDYENWDNQLRYSPPYNIFGSIKDKIFSIKNKVFGISEATKEAMHQTIVEAGGNLREEARKAAQAEVNKIEEKMLDLAKRTAEVITNQRARQIETNILSSVDKILKSVDYSTREAMERAGPEIADLLRTEIKTQAEEAIIKYSKEKIESLVRTEIMSKIGDILNKESTEARKFLKSEMDLLLKDSRQNLSKYVDDILNKEWAGAGKFLKSEMDKLLKDAYQNFNEKVKESKKARDLLKSEIDKLLKDIYQNFNKKTDKLECDIVKVRSYILEAGAKSLHESAKALSFMAKN